MRSHLIALALLSLIFVGCTPRHYTATATLQIIEPTYENNTGELKPNILMSADHANRHINVMASQMLLTAVSKQLTREGFDSAVMDPYPNNGTATDLIAILKAHRTVKEDPTKRTLQVSYKHPTPEIAIRVANTFADAYIEYMAQLNIEGSEKAVKDLSLRADQQAVIIESLKEELVTFAQQHQFSNSKSLDSIINAAGLELKPLTLRLLVEKDANNLEQASLAQKALTAKELELIELSKVRVQHNSLLRNLEVQEGFYKALKQREQQERDFTENGRPAGAIIIERASIQ